METFIVEFDQDEAVRDYLRALGIDPNEFGRAAFRRALEELQRAKPK